MGNHSGKKINIHLYKFGRIYFYSTGCSDVKQGLKRQGVLIDIVD
jgi:hypothetical protein